MKNKFLLFILISCSVFAQKNSEIEKLLNKELKNELELQQQVDYLAQDSLIVVREFKIFNNILSYQTKHKRYNGDGYYSRKQEVALKDLFGVGKDICVLFETNNKVKITDTNYHNDGSIDTNTFYDTYFRTQFCNQKNNEYLGKDLEKLFKKAGYNLKISFWYD